MCRTTPSKSSRWWRWVNIPDSFIKNALKVSLSQSRTLEVLVGLDLLGASQRLLIWYRLHALLSERFEGGCVLSKIELGSDKNDGNVGRMMVDLGVPLKRCQQSQEAMSCLFTFAFTLSNDGGLTMEKQMRKTSVWGYERGRSLS
jgi:hypothetical protein